MSNEEGMPKDPQDLQNFIDDIMKQAEDLLKNSFSPEAYVESVFALACQAIDFNVTNTGTSVKVESSHKGIEEVKWQELKKVSMVTSDKGPLCSDVFIVLFSNTGACAIPMDNLSYNDIYEKIADFEGLDFENVIESSMSSENREFVIWEKAEESSASALSYALFHCDPFTKPPFTLELGFSDKSVKELQACEHIPDAIQKLEDFCKKENISKNSNFTLLYPIYLHAMDTDEESAMHSIAWLVKEQADKQHWNFDRIGGYTGKAAANFFNS